MHNKEVSRVGGSVSIRRKGLEGKFAVETDLSLSDLKDDLTFQVEIPDTEVKVGFQIKIIPNWPKCALNTFRLISSRSVV